MTVRIAHAAALSAVIAFSTPGCLAEKATAKATVSLLWMFARMLEDACNKLRNPPVGLFRGYVNLPTPSFQNLPRKSKTVTLLKLLRVKTIKTSHEFLDPPGVSVVMEVVKTRLSLQKVARFVQDWRHQLDGTVVWASGGKWGCPG